MSDDFGTVNLKSGERSRELEVLRGHYLRHREALVAMTEDAPTESLAMRYQQLIAELDRSLAKLSELESAVTAAPPPRAPEAPRHPARSGGETLPVAAAASAAGMRPLAGATHEDDREIPHPPDVAAARVIPGSRLILIGVIALVALAAIGWLIWRASSDRAVTDTVVEAPVTTAEPDATVTETVAPPSLLVATPSTHNYGVVRKGTRATRQFEIANETEEPLTIQVARSECRCLYYEHAPVIPPKAKESLTVTIDASKARAGELQESLRISARSDPSIATTIDVVATIR